MRGFTYHQAVVRNMLGIQFHICIMFFSSKIKCFKKTYRKNPNWRSGRFAWRSSTATMNLFINRNRHVHCAVKFNNIPNGFPFDLNIFVFLLCLVWVIWPSLLSFDFLFSAFCIIRSIRLYCLAYRMCIVKFEIFGFVND